jgi:hypothetical protein
MHQFKVGAIVRIRPGKKGSIDAPPGAYVVTKLLPQSGGEFGYQIKSSLEEHDRVAKERPITGCMKGSRLPKGGAIFRRKVFK